MRIDEASADARWHRGKIGAQGAITLESKALIMSDVQSLLARRRCGRLLRLCGRWKREQRTCRSLADRTLEALPSRSRATTLRTSSRPSLAVSTRSSRGPPELAVVASASAELPPALTPSGRERDRLPPPPLEARRAAPCVFAYSVAFGRRQYARGRARIGMCISYSTSTCAGMSESSPAVRTDDAEGDESRALALWPCDAGPVLDWLSTCTAAQLARCLSRNRAGRSAIEKDGKRQLDAARTAIGETARRWDAGGRGKAGVRRGFDRAR